MARVICPSCRRRRSALETRAGRLPSCARCGVPCMLDTTTTQLATDKRKPHPHWLGAVIGVLTAVIVTAVVVFMLFLMVAYPRRR